jgi:hypothetical protein
MGLALPFGLGRFGNRFREEALGSLVDLNPVWYTRELVRHFSSRPTVQLCATRSAIRMSATLFSLWLVCVGHMGSF